MALMDYYGGQEYRAPLLTHLRKGFFARSLEVCSADRRQGLRPPTTPHLFFLGVFFGFLQPPPYKNNMQGRSELQSTEISEIERTKTSIENLSSKVVDNGLNITLVNL
jgi:hypothetical protein